MKSKNVKNNKQKSKQLPVKTNSSANKSAGLSFHQASRNALGRGLSALIRPVSVSVPNPPLTVAQPAQTEASYVVPQPEGQALAQVVIAPEEKPIFKPEIIEGGKHNDNVAQDNGSVDPIEGLVMLSLESMRPNPNQPRKTFLPEEITSLAQSIRETGLLQPILVRRDEQSPGKFEIVAGERRYRAAIEAGLTQVPVIIKELANREALEISIIENVQRSDLNPIEEALAYQRLVDEFGQTQAEIAQAVGKDRVSITNCLRLLKLSPKVIEHITQKKLSAGHGKVLLSLESVEAQERLAERIIQENMSVRETERQLQRYLNNKTQGKVTRSVVKEKSLSIIDLEDRIRRVLGTKIALNVNQQGEGELRVFFYSKDELHSLIERLGA